MRAGWDAYENWEYMEEITENFQFPDFRVRRTHVPRLRSLAAADVPGPFVIKSRRSQRALFNNQSTHQEPVQRCSARQWRSSVREGLDDGWAVDDEVTRGDLER